MTINAGKNNFYKNELFHHPYYLLIQMVAITGK
jgi:hypothetical protein